MNFDMYFTRGRFVSLTKILIYFVLGITTWSGVWSFFNWRRGWVTICLDVARLPGRRCFLHLPKLLLVFFSEYFFDLLDWSFQMTKGNIFHNTILHFRRKKGSAGSNSPTTRYTYKWVKVKPHPVRSPQYLWPILNQNGLCFDRS